MLDGRTPYTKLFGNEMAVIISNTNWMLDGRTPYTKLFGREMAVIYIQYKLTLDGRTYTLYAILIMH